MTETEILKAQVAALEKLVQIKDQTISSLQTHPRPWWYTPAGGMAVTGASVSASGLTGQSIFQTNANMGFSAGANS